jgi:uncharacterized membrane protein
MLDISLMHYAEAEDPKQHAMLRIDASALTGISLAVRGLLGTQRDYSHLFLMSIMTCFLVVLPTHNLAENCFEAQIFESVQKSVLLWCVGGILTAVVLASNVAPATATASVSTGASEEVIT